MKRVKNRLAGIVGNILEHYDNALFGLMAPFLAPLFFGGQDPVTALIMTYGIMPLGVISRPIGSLFFGWIGDAFGRMQALSLSLVGMALVTFAMGCLPLYSQVGVAAPILLAILRMLQSFFMAGETVGGAIYLLEETEEKKRTFFSSLYDASSVGGVLLASLAVTGCFAFGVMHEAWRLLFWAGATTAIVGLILSRGVDQTAPRQTVRQSVFYALRGNLRPFLAVVFASGFSYITYMLAFDLMNGFIPLVTGIDPAVIMGINSVLLVLDMLLLPCFGCIAARVGKERLMLFATLFLVTSNIPLFWLLSSGSIIAVLVARTLLVVGGVAFSAPYHAWAQDLVPKEHRYTLLSLGYTLGTRLIGAPAVAVSLWLYKSTGFCFAPGLYILLFGLLACFCILKNRQLQSDGAFSKVANEVALKRF